MGVSSILMHVKISGLYWIGGYVCRFDLISLPPLSSSCHMILTSQFLLLSLCLSFSFPPLPARRFQHMSSQDAGPPVGSLGQGWDGKDRYGLFPGDYGYVSMKNGGRTTELSELDPLAQGSGAYVDAHKYLEKLQAQSVRGQKAYEAKKAAERQEAMKKGIKQAQKLYKHTLKHGYGKDLDNKYWQTLEVMNSESHK